MIDQYLKYAEGMGGSSELTNWIKTTLAASLKKEPPPQVDVEHILDWCCSSDAPPKMIRMSYEQAKSKAAAWTKAQQKKGAHIKEKKSDTKTICKFKDGSRIAELIGKPAFEREGYLMSHCFYGDTRLVTDEGLIQISELALSGSANLLTRYPKLPGSASFVESKIKPFGKRPLYRIVFSRAGKKFSVLTTSQHRWFYKDATKNKNVLRVKETITTGLLPGFRIPTVYAKRSLLAEEGAKGVSLSCEGIIHGATFGDGTISNGRYAKLELVGKKQSLLKYASRSARLTNNVLRSSTTIHDLPSFYKSLPSRKENASYLLGFLAGLIATDGSIGISGNASISNANKDTLEYIESICFRFGLMTTGIVMDRRDGFGLKNRSIGKLTFRVGALPNGLFLLAHHQKRNTSKKQDRHWIVKSVKSTGLVGDVYCAIVPKTKSFTIENNLLTGNCILSYYGRADRKIYSYRDKDNNPHATFDIVTNGKDASQVKGKGNGSIHPKYIKPILFFFKKIGIDVRESEMKNLGYYKVDDEFEKLIIAVVGPIKKTKIGGSEYVFAY